jgi:hypothetical protein
MRRWVGPTTLAVTAWACAALGWMGCTGQSSFDLPAIDAGRVDTQDKGPCSAWAAAVCAREMSCLGDPEAIQWTDLSEFDLPQCVARTTLICEVVATDPNVSFDAQKLSQCTYPSDCTVPERDLPVDCLSPGRSPPGATCVFHEACTTGVCDTTSSICGTCAAPRVPCACAAGQVCAGIGLDGGPVCDPVSEVGGSCTTTIECEHSYCLIDTPDGKGTCVVLVALGGLCGDGEGASPGREGTPCAGDDAYCDLTLHCSPIEGVPSGVCGAPDDGGPLIECSGFGACDPTTGTCLQPAPDGQICDETQGLGCMAPAQCIANRCLYPSLAYCGL